MNLNRETGRYLEAERRSLAEATVDRQYDAHPDLRDRYGEGGRKKCVEDSEYHLLYLAAATTFASPILFAEYVAWAKPVMTAYGVRMEDVEDHLTCLRETLLERLPSEMLKAAMPCFDAGLQNLQHAPLSIASFLQGDDELTQLARRYLDAALRVQRHEAIRLVLEAEQNGVTVQEIYLRVFEPCQREIGRLWQLRQITVAQEHYCTATTQLAMSQLYMKLFSRRKNGHRAIATSVSGELHEMGLRIVTDMFEADGWETMYLGANVPENSIVQAVEQFRPDVLLISATMAFHLDAVHCLISLLRSSQVEPQPKIIFGGYPCNSDADLWQRIGADGHGRDALQALSVANRLVASKEPSRGTPHVAERELPRNLPRTLPPLDGDSDIFNELARLNNELLTAQRELARKHAELERLNQRLVEADESKDRFLATLAHEMRNPLSPIASGLELLRLAPEDKALVEEVCNTMERQTHDLVRLVDDLMDVSRITRGKITLRNERVELRAVVRGAVDASRARVDEFGHELTVSLPAEPILVEADPTRLSQIISNLLTNAAKYTQKGGRIWLTAEVRGQTVTLSVKDTGIGIPADMLERIFEMFTQVNRSDRSEGGLGIGLMLVKRLAEMHGGIVQARSGGEGQGSEFIITLPIGVESPEQPKPSVRLRPASGRIEI